MRRECKYKKNLEKREYDGKDKKDAENRKLWNKKSK